MLRPHPVPMLRYGDGEGLLCRSRPRGRRWTVARGAWRERGAWVVMSRSLRGGCRALQRSGAMNNGPPATLCLGGRCGVWVAGCAVGGTRLRLIAFYIVRPCVV